MYTFGLSFVRCGPVLFHRSTSMRPTEPCDGLKRPGGEGRHHFSLEHQTQTNSPEESEVPMASIWSNKKKKLYTICSEISISSPLYDNIGVLHPSWRGWEIIGTIPFYLYWSAVLSVVRDKGGLINTPSKSPQMLWWAKFLFLVDQYGHRRGQLKGEARQKHPFNSSHWPQKDAWQT